MTGDPMSMDETSGGDKTETRGCCWNKANKSQKASPTGRNIPVKACILRLDSWLKSRCPHPATEGMGTLSSSRCKVKSACHSGAGDQGPS